jgi:hypothetical protein
VADRDLSVRDVEEEHCSPTCEAEALAARVHACWRERPKHRGLREEELRAGVRPRLGAWSLEVRIPMERR